MPLSEEYRAKAIEMRRLAAEQADPLFRAEFEQMARGWDAMAARREEDEKTASGRANSP